MCPYCQQLKGQHLPACKEMRILQRIDVIVTDMRQFHHTKALLGVIFAKRIIHLPRKK